MNKDYLKNITALLEKLENTQEAVIDRVTALCAACIQSGELGDASVELLLEKGIRPPVFMSANTDAGDSANKDVLEAYKPRIPKL